MSEGAFLWPDYLVFSLILGLSASIGIYHGFKGRHTQTVENYLMADRNMHPLPVALSLFVTYMSAISFLGDPVEVYSHGAVYVFIGLGYMLVMPFFAHCFAPYYQSLKITSAYEYLGIRYNKYIRVLGTLLNFNVLMFAAIALYAPSLAFSQVTGVPVWAAVVMTGLVCTVYTTVGGMKAVLWADSAQFGVMLLGVTILLVKGSSHMGGFSRVLEIAAEGGRLNFNKFDPNVLVRSTFWTYAIGGWFRILVAFVSSQMFIQRVCTVNSKRKATLVSYLIMPLFGGIVLVFLMMGLLLYAYFHDCDPQLSGRILKRDQMIPLMMTEVLHFIPGFPGFFLAALYAAALSTLSSAQNGLATTTMADIIEPLVMRFRGKPMDQRIATHVARFLCFIIGILNILLSVFFENMKGSIFQLTISIDAMLSSPKAGLFVIGIFAPMVDTASAMLGACCAAMVTLYFGLNMNIYPPPSQALPFSTAGCPVENGTTFWVNNSTTMVSLSSIPADSAAAVPDPTASSLSPLLIAPIGVILTCILSIIFSFIRRFFFKQCSGRVHENQADPESLIPSANPSDQQVQLKDIKQVPGEVQEKVPEKVQEEKEAKVHLVT